jgi:HTH-type transcriptional regulator, competence development regulator
MPDEKPESSSLGSYLRSLRSGLDMSLRAVEEATGKGVSNAYLSQLESGIISKPSPHILYSLSAIYGVPYEKLMERAGYIAPSAPRLQGEKHGRAATFSIDNLSAEEEKELLDYLSWYRSKRGPSEKGR